MPAISHNSLIEALYLSLISLIARYHNSLIEALYLSLISLIARYIE